MENTSTRRFFSSEFVIKNKLSFSTVIILQDIYYWIFSENPPKRKIKNNKTYHFLSQSHFSRLNYGLLSPSAVNHIFKKLSEIGIIDSSFDINNEHYTSFNWLKIKESLLPDEELQNMENNEWWKKIHAYADAQIQMEKEAEKNSYNKSEVNDVLFDISSESKKRYSLEAYAIAVRLIEKSKKNNTGYFSHKYNEYDEEQTKLFNKSCQLIQAIYDGNFLNSRRFPLTDKFIENQQFPINLSEVNEKLTNVIGNWKRVKNLIFSAYDNFALMHDLNYCPCEKKYLTKTLSEWFYGISDEAGKFQSQFIQCLFEIPLTKKFYSEKKADKIFEGLSSKSCKYGEQLIDLNPKMNSGSAWENIKKMVEWAKLLLTSDSNSSYWIASPSEIILKFVEWAKIKNVQVSVNSFDINWCVENNGPWVWFLQDAIKLHGLNSNIVGIVTADDFLDCYNKNNISWDDMEECEIPTF